MSSLSLLLLLEIDFPNQCSDYKDNIKSTRSTIVSLLSGPFLSAEVTHSVAHQSSHRAPWIRALSKGTIGANREIWSGRLCKTISCNISLFSHRTLGCRDMCPSFSPRFQDSNSVVFAYSSYFSWLLLILKDGSSIQMELGDKCILLICFMRSKLSVLGYSLCG